MVDSSYLNGEAVGLVGISRERSDQAVSLAFELANGRKKRRRSYVGGRTKLFVCLHFIQPTLFSLLAQS